MKTTNHNILLSNILTMFQ